MSEKRVLARERRRARVRAKIIGTPERPRLSVHRSLNQIYAQLVDDQSGKTLLAMSSLNVKFKEATGNKTEMSKAVGLELATMARAANIEKIVFDRGYYLYHGRVRALAEAVREGGLVF